MWCFPNLVTYFFCTLKGLLFIIPWYEQARVAEAVSEFGMLCCGPQAVSISSWVAQCPREWAVESALIMEIRWMGNLDQQISWWIYKAVAEKTRHLTGHFLGLFCNKIHRSDVFFCQCFEGVLFTRRSWLPLSIHLIVLFCGSKCM